MAGTPYARAFAIVSAPLGTGGTDFATIAHAAAAADTLEDFLRDMKARYREANPMSAGPAAAALGPSAAAPAARPAPKRAVVPAAAPGRTALR
jgi:hypothetical protein